MELHKERVLKEDGRYLYFYTFSDVAEEEPEEEDDEPEEDAPSGDLQLKPHKPPTPND